MLSVELLLGTRGLFIVLQEDESIASRTSVGHIYDHVSFSDPEVGEELSDFFAVSGVWKTSEFEASVPVVLSDIVREPDGVLVVGALGVATELLVGLLAALSRLLVVPIFVLAIGALGSLGIITVPVVVVAAAATEAASTTTTASSFASVFKLGSLDLIEGGVL